MRPRASIRPSRLQKSRSRLRRRNQIPQFTKEKQPHYITRPSKTLEDKSPPPAAQCRALRARRLPGGSLHAIHYGRGRWHECRHGFYRLRAAAISCGRFSWYVDAVRSRVSSKLVAEHGGSKCTLCPRAVVTFDILRNGAITNVQVLAVERQRVGGHLRRARDRGIEPGEIPFHPGTRARRCRLSSGLILSAKGAVSCPCQCDGPLE